MDYEFFLNVVSDSVLLYVRAGQVTVVLNVMEKYECEYSQILFPVVAEGGLCEGKSLQCS